MLEMSACRDHGALNMIETLYETIDPQKIVYEDLSFETYAIIEGTKVPMFYSDLEEGILEYDMLFKEEKLREKLQTRGPFLVRLDFESEVGKEETLHLLKECYGKNAMLLFALPMEMPQTLLRVREIFYLKDDHGEDMGIIRFYEPEIFKGLMYEGDKGLLRNLFVHIYGYWCEDKEEEKLAHYRYDGEHVRRNYVTLPKETP